MRLPLLLTALLAAPLTAGAASHSGALSADVTGADGTAHGSVSAQQTASGLIVLTLDLKDVPPGEHGVHLHETGDCSAGDFSSAGGHLADGKEHGVMAEGGPHPGDLPNIHIPDSGAAKVVYFAQPDLTMDLMSDADGTAFIVHSGADDYASQPSGAAGSRIACGVLSKGM